MVSTALKKWVIVLGIGAGYVSQGEWWRNGFVVTTINTVVWFTVGIAWWKLIGLW